jgi:hypothetical protein
MTEANGGPEALEWADAVAVEDFDTLLERYGAR